MNNKLLMAGALIAVIAISIYASSRTSPKKERVNNDLQPSTEDRLAPLEAELKKYQADIFSKCETDDIMSGCTYLLASRDTVSSSSLIRGAAQATIQAYYKEFAEGLDDKQLIWKLKDEQSRAAFYSQYSNSSSEARDIDRIDSALAGNAYLAEFEKRGLKDPSIDTDAFFGPCWGIPEGWCLE